MGKDWNEKEGGITTVLLIWAAHYWAVPYCYYKYMNVCLVYLGYLDFRKRTTASPSIAIAVPISLTLKPGKSQSSLGGGVLEY